MKVRAVPPWLCWFALACAVVLAVAWALRWDYHQKYHRVNRWTGEVQRISPDGWVRVVRPAFP